jgi:hypothetical protein
MRKGKFEDEYVAALATIESLEVRLLSADLIRQESLARIAELETTIHAALNASKCQDTSLVEYELRKALHLPPAE